MKLVQNVAGTHKCNKVNLVTQTDFSWSKNATKLQSTDVQKEKNTDKQKGLFLELAVIKWFL